MVGDLGHVLHRALILWRSVVECAAGLRRQGAAKRRPSGACRACNPVRRHAHGACRIAEPTGARPPIATTPPAATPRTKLPVISASEDTHPYQRRCSVPDHPLM